MFHGPIICRNHNDMKTEKFDSFFKGYSKNVDNADRQEFWRFSDALILAIIQRHFGGLVAPGQTILDAGGGTARWDIVLAKHYDAKFIVYDLSEDMLAQAQKNISAAGLADRIRCVQGDLEDMGRLADGSVDHAVSIYNPISFVTDQERAFRELHRVMRKGGFLLVMGQGYHNAIASKANNYETSPEELSKLVNSYVVQWNAYVPPLKVFSKESLESGLAAAGFSILKTYGVPIFAQPGMEDFDPENISKSKISEALSDPAYFKVLFEAEMACNGAPDAANRGMNLFSIVQK